MQANIKERSSEVAEINGDTSAGDTSAPARLDGAENPDHPKTTVWDGRLDHFSEEEIAVRNALADAARAANWEAVFGLLDTHRYTLSPNSWRAYGKSWYTPLHQAAWHNAPVSVVEELIQRGGWPSLRTASGETAHDIAVKKGHITLGDSLVPPTSKRVDNDVFSKLDEHLARLVESRIRPALPVRLRHPATEALAETTDQALWFPIPGMYGGFSIRLMRSYLFVESWCRVAGGSGQAHVVTTEGFTLVEEGFV
ncbi:ankyrin repeat domain-containing protein [Rhodococcus sp. 105337]|uniref:ankyrin repeat domain-containing protein n=1 Tax=Rhodococcus sp. 105337 TaxID=2725310 RepID=UPI001F0FB9B0|nr:ankyrin repeat domain-containing protein [Rhodococcus sp. 105337]